MNDCISIDICVNPKTSNTRYKLLLLLVSMMMPWMAVAQTSSPVLVDYDSIRVGAEQFDEYLPLVNHQRVAVLVNQASMIGSAYLVDVLLDKQVNLVKIFTPEHGFRGTKDAGENVESDTLSSGITLVSLYGKKKKPTAADLANVDVLLVDLQDVGARFYTYISTMSLAMKSCAENGVKVIVLDRPNPNGFYVDGPVLEEKYQSFVGMHPVPIVYGMTIGEYALMVNGEGWLDNSVACDLRVIKMKGYRHNMIVKLNIAPSPNLPDWESVYLYPSLCLFEGTSVSVGRGTDFPFQVYGFPGHSYGNFAFTPRSIPGKSKHPKWEGKTCYGQSLSGFAHNYRFNRAGLHLTWLIDAWKVAGDSSTFFNAYFEKLAGTASLRRQIMAGDSPEQIRASWQPALNNFKKIREKYLLYE